MTSPTTQQLNSPAGLHSGGPHHDGSGLYVQAGTPGLGDVVPVRVRVPAQSAVESVYVRVVRDAEPIFVPAVADGGDENEKWFTADIPVHNSVTNYRWLLDRGSTGYSWLNGTGEYQRDIADLHDFRLTVYPAGPDWALDAVVYQVFPDRFASSGAAREMPSWAMPAQWDDEVVHVGPDTPRQYFGGDLDGIRDHLSHLTELGANTLYLTPIFPARSNHRYNASSFAHVDPLLGGDEALARLAAEVHQRGMRIVGDLTTNHSGDDHPWFSLALADPAAVERSFYYVADDGSYAAWLGHQSLPKFDLQSPPLRERMFGPDDSIVARWLRPPFELDGWRIDVANMTGRHAQHDHANSVAREIRATMAAVRPESVLLAEHCHDAAGDLTGDGWQGTMNYAGFTRPVWSWLTAPDNGLGFLGMPVGVPRRSGPATVTTMRDFAASVPWKVAERNWNLLASHDTPRFLTVTGERALVEVGVGLQMTLPGSPMIFAGEELGFEGVDGEHARTPIPWHRRERWDQHTLRFFQELIAVRQAHPALRRGGLRWLFAADDALGFLRETTDERILIVVSRGPWPGTTLPARLLGDGGPQMLYGGMTLRVDGRAVAVPGDGPGVGIWQLATEGGTS